MVTYWSRWIYGHELLIKAEIRDYKENVSFYVTNRETNATFRRGDTLKAMTLERGLELLAGRRAWEAENDPSPKKSRKKAAKAKPGATAPTLTKNTVKKAATKKKAAKKATGKVKK